ncbi:hypothetical protein [Ectopseudomonas khazarica]
MNTAEAVVVKGDSHKVLKAWKEQHAAEKVQSWHISQLTRVAKVALLVLR